MENVSGVALPRSHSYEARDAAGSGWDCCRRARGWCCCRGVDAESLREDTVKGGRSSFQACKLVRKRRTSPSSDSIHHTKGYDRGHVGIG